MPAMGTCPRCTAPITSAPDAEGLLLCSRCGVQLRAHLPPSPRLSQPGTAIPAAGTPNPKSGLETLQDELQAVRSGQQEVLARVAEILALLKAAAPVGAVSASFESVSSQRGPHVPLESAPPRTRRRQKTVLLIDDDADARGGVAAALAQAQVPVRSVSDGNSALAMIAADKPDIIVLELDLQGTTSGKDVVNMIKATMEWVDIPILLYTRIPVASQNEARQIHGADEYVVKGPGSADTLAARVIAIFQRG